MKNVLKSKRQQGFTLIELLIVIAIIGILAAVLIPNLLGARKNAFDTGALQCGKQIQAAETNFAGKHVSQGYGANVTALDSDLMAACGDPATIAAGSGSNIQVTSTDPAGSVSGTGDGSIAVNSTGTTFTTYVFDVRGKTVYKVTEQSITAE